MQIENVEIAIQEQQESMTFQLQSPVFPMTLHHFPPLCYGL